MALFTKPGKLMGFVTSFHLDVFQTSLLAGHYPVIFPPLFAGFTRGAFAALENTRALTSELGCVARKSGKWYQL